MAETKKTAAAEKAAATKEAVKTEAKATVKNVEEKLKTAAKKATARKTATAKKAPKTEIVLQYAGKEVYYADMIKKATQLSRKAIKTTVKDIKIYVKPEENMAYYVANGGEQIGSFEI